VEQANPRRRRTPSREGRGSRAPHRPLPGRGGQPPQPPVRQADHPPQRSPAPEARGSYKRDLRDPQRRAQV
ncbi:MAG: hypothetical protein AVDCRST_MAG14-1576, partial [uncultured Rubrobacteraceae bacterium]